MSSTISQIFYLAHFYKKYNEEMCMTNLKVENLL